MIIINFKNYVTGEKALALAKLIEKHLPKAIICPPTNDITNISQKTKLKVFSQYLPKNNSPKARGTLLNHSDHPLNFEKIKKAKKLADKNKLKVIICVGTTQQAEKFLSLKPWAMALEDKKLISTKKSITSFKQNEVKKFVAILKKTKIIPLCGAGIHSREDVAAAKKLGCKGVLIASAIANTPPKKAGKLLKEISRSYHAHHKSK
ncbi:MAG: hypothetical protein KJ600_03250 [Nanoarchaeota archaeon]|nr:hypothetical protein [Nanoarchaeota archaeon]MBU1103544.1 hypothetical protein [Nanoarchaeota archaeon]